MCNAHHSVTVQYVQRYSFASQLSTVNQSIWHVASTQRLTKNHFAKYPGKFRRINQKSRPPLKNGCSALQWIWVLWHKFSSQKHWITLMATKGIICKKVFPWLSNENQGGLKCPFNTAVLLYNTMQYHWYDTLPRFWGAPPPRAFCPALTFLHCVEFANLKLRDKEMKEAS